MMTKVRTIWFIVCLFLTIAPCFTNAEESPGHRYCNICGPRRMFTLPDKVISIPTQGDFTCALLDQRSREGFVPPSRCHNLQAFTSGVRCGCVPKTPPPSPEQTPATSSPSLTPTAEESSSSSSKPSQFSTVNPSNRPSVSFSQSPSLSKKPTDSPTTNVPSQGSTSAPIDGPTTCPGTQLDIDFSFTTDGYGHETSWALVDKNNGRKIDGGEDYNDVSFYQIQNCLPAANKCYTLTIFDAGGDGFCCGGQPAYSVLVNGDTIATGSNHNFGYEISFDFGPGCPSGPPATPDPTSAPTPIPTSPWVSAGRNPNCIRGFRCWRFYGGGVGSGGSESSAAFSTINDGEADVDDNEDGKEKLCVPLLLEVHADGRASEISVLYEDGSGGIVFSRGFGTFEDWEVATFQARCVDITECSKLTISDEFGDGLLDGGKIVLRLDDEIDYEGGDYGEGLVFTIGEDCADET